VTSRVVSLYHIIHTRHYIPLRAWGALFVFGITDRAMRHAKVCLSVLAY
jgi:hypothetical protein